MLRFLCLTGALLIPCRASAQTPIPVHAGFGVDTTAVGNWTDAAWQREIAPIFRAWREYLQSNPRQQQPTSLWSAEEQRRWPGYDLTAPVAYHGMPATVLDIRPARAGATAEFVVKTLFSSTIDGQVKPVALTRVYVVRENDRWVFSNALPRLTRDWQRVRVGTFTYIIAPGHTFDRPRAERAIAFTDSVARLFDVPAPDSLTYYVATSPEEVHRIMGVDWSFGGTGGGYVMPWNRLVLSGDPVFGEEHRHELTHYVLAPITAERRAHAIIVEGVASWLGGSTGRDFRTMMRDYASFLRAHPELTLDAVIQDDASDFGSRPTGAVLVLLVHERGGINAVKELLISGRTDQELRAALMKLLGASWEEIGARWRERVLSLGPPR